MSINFVNNDNWSNHLTHSLSKYGFSLNAYTFDTINDNESTISNSQSSCDFGREINMARGIDKINKITGFFSVFFHWVLVFIIQRYTSRFNSDSSILFILSCVHVSRISSFGCFNNTSFSNQWVCQSRFSVIDVSNNWQVTDVILVVHNLSNLFNWKVYH